MISAFGVEHGYVSKSFVPGAGYKAAKKLSAAERQKVHAKTLQNRFKFGVEGKTPEKTAPSAKGRRIHDDTPQVDGSPRVKTPRTGKKLLARKKHDAAVQTSKGQLHPLLGQAFPDGKGGGLIRTYKGGEGKDTFAHERAHLTPKRNPVRFRERAMADPVRNGREEGRADFVASGKATPGKYPGDEDFKRGYNEVQTKMAQAKFRRELRKK